MITGPAGDRLVAADFLVFDDGAEVPLLAAALNLPAAVPANKLKEFLL